MKSFIFLCLAVLATAYAHIELNNHAFPQRKQLWPRSGTPPGQSPRSQNTPSPGSRSSRQSSESMDSGPRYTAPSKLSYGRYPNTDSESEGDKTPNLPNIPETYAEAASKGISAQRLANLVPDASSAPRQYQHERQLQQPPKPAGPSKPSRESAPTNPDLSDQLHHPFSKLSHNDQQPPQNPHPAQPSFPSTTFPEDPAGNDRKTRTLHEKALQAAMLRRLRQTGLSANPSGFMGSMPSGFDSGGSSPRSQSLSPSSSSSGLRTSSTVSRASSPPGSVVPSRGQSPMAERGGHGPMPMPMQMPAASGSGSGSGSASASSSRFKSGAGASAGNRSPPRRG